MKFNFILSKDAKKFLEKQEKLVQKRILKALLKLSENPYDWKNNDIKLMESKDKEYRLRVGTFRIIFKIEKDKLIISVLEIDNRGDIY
jgi:mRNA interferase RelE/StbE